MRVILGKGGDFLLEKTLLFSGAGFKTLKALTNVGEEARLRKLTVGDCIDAAFDLLANALSDRLGERRVPFDWIERSATELGFQKIKQMGRARQAADMGDLDMIDILLSSRRPSSFS